jgi:TolB-like protein/tetratricopeptide (TPR) repeat protein/tRNA A-37 threonylcarbamoyl transferase component Bud32
VPIGARVAAAWAPAYPRHRMTPTDERAQSGGEGVADAMPEDPALFARIKSVFLEAVDLPEDERAAFLARVGAADPRVRQEVESLLQSDQAAGAFCETPAATLLGAEPTFTDVASPQLHPGARLGAYEIQEFIAAGGMGEVYRARHTVLTREVAIKIVSGNISDDAARRRLLREARHAAILTHPNICAIYEVGDSDAGPFVVMQYIPGRNLSALLRERLPTVQEALSYAAQIADALEHAHRQGVMHRDLKSSNVVVAAADSRAVVLDFGLARRIPTDMSQSHDSTLTARDALAGTLSYMAPEVLLGRGADRRSDIWSLGVVLYELVTGTLPFRGQTQYETSSAILGNSPQSIPGRVPLSLRLVIERCLMKDPDRRYQTADDVKSALASIQRRRAWPLIGRLLVSTRRRTLYVLGGFAIATTVAVYAGPRLHERVAMARPHFSTLALLPLQNATGQPDADYYADGMTDDIIARLGALGNVRIISKISAARARRTERTLQAIGQQLGTDALVEGSLRRASDRVTLDLRLLQPSTGAVLWSDRYERPTSEVLALEADAVKALAVAIRLNIRTDVRERLATIRAVSPPVYEEYLKGRFEWNSRTPKSLERAVDHFTRAIELDPTYAPAHAALADCYNQLGTVMVGSGSPREFRPRAAAEAIKALQLDPGSAEAHAALGYVRHYDWQWDEAEKEFRRAVELNPSYALARIWYANLLMSRQRMDDALHQVSIARDLDPFSLIVNTNVGWVLTFAGRPGEAVKQLAGTLELDSTYVQARWRLAGALMRTNRFDEAVAQAQRVVIESHRSAPALALLADTYASAGDEANARSLFRELRARSRNEYVPPWSIGGVFLSLGARDSAMYFLEKAFAERSNAIAYLLANPEFEPLRDDPRYRAIVVRAGLR